MLGENNNNVEKTIFSESQSDSGSDDLRQQMNQLEHENRLVKSISVAESLDDMFGEIASYLEERWGFNMFGVQLLDSTGTKLKFYRNYCRIFPQDILDQVVDCEVPLNDKSSVSAKVAIDQKWVFTDFDQIPKEITIPDLDKKATELFDIRQNLIVPVVDSGVTIGVIHIISVKGKIEVNRSVINEVLSFISSITTLIKVTQKREDISCIQKIQNHKLDLLSTITSTLDMNIVIELLSEELEKLNCFDAFLINIIDGSGSKYICEKSFLPLELNALQDVLYKVSFPFFPESAENECFFTKKFLFLNDERRENCSEFFANSLSRLGMNYIVIIPVLFNNCGIGHIMAFRKREHVQVEKIPSISDICEFFSGAIESCRRYKHLKNKEDQINRHEEDRKQFLRFIEKVNEISSSEEVVYNIISSEFLTYFPFDMVSIHMLEDDYLVIKNILTSYSEDLELSERVYAFYQDYPYKIAAGEGAQVIPIINKEPLLIKDIDKVKHLPMSPKDSIGKIAFGSTRTALYVPIIFCNEPIGLLSMWSIRSVVDVKERDISFISEICGFIGSAINNAKLYSMVESQKNKIEITVSQLEKTQEELKSARDAAEASTKAKSAFLANMSHEIRTPMNAIINFSNLALKKAVDEGQQDYLGKILNSSQALLGIVNDILDLSKIEANKIELENVELNIGKLIEEVIVLFSETVHQKDIELWADGIDEITNTYYGDPYRIRQIIINLVNNAIKFTEQGYVKIVVTKQEYYDHKAERVIFSVEDSGIGIPEDKLDSLFESFSQADTSTTRKYGGTGLGLSISKGLCHLMNGEMRISSEVGKGSRFEFSLPMAIGGELSEIDAENSNDEDDLSTEEKYKKVLSGKRILVAEDNILNQQIAAEFLQLVDVEFQIAASGVDALKYMEKEEYDLILTDIQMPEMDGYIFTENVRKMLNNDDIPIIAMTAHAMSGYRDICLEKGMNDYVSKPIDQEIFYKTIAKWTKSEEISKKTEKETKKTFDGSWDNIDFVSDILPDTALSAMGGNIKIFVNIIKIFQDQFLNADEIICKHIENDQIEMARTIAHTLKGAAATIGSFKTSEISLLIEDNLNNHQIDKPQTLEKIKELSLELNKLKIDLQTIVRVIES